MLPDDVAFSSAEVAPDALPLPFMTTWPSAARVSIATKALPPVEAALKSFSVMLAPLMTSSALPVVACAWTSPSSVTAA